VFSLLRNFSPVAFFSNPPGRVRGIGLFATIVGVVLVLGIALASTRAVGQAIVSDSDISHVVEVMGEGPIYRWEKPIRFQVVGLMSPWTRGLFHGAVAKIARSTGLDIAEASDPKDINTWFIFVNDIRSVATLDDIKVLMKESGETEEAYNKRVASWPDTAVTRMKRSVNGGEMVYFAAMANPTLLEVASWERLFLVVVYQSVATINNASDLSRKSLMNRGWDPQSMPSELDIELVRAIYSDEFPFDPKDAGGSIAELIKVIRNRN